MTDPTRDQGSRATPPTPAPGTTHYRSDARRAAAAGESPIPHGPTSSRLRPRTRGAWATVILAGTFAALWIVFAVRAVDRNDHPWPTLTPPPAAALPDLNATVAAANRLLFPDRPYGSPAASPLASSMASPVASPAASPATSPIADPIVSPVASPLATPLT